MWLRKYLGQLMQSMMVGFNMKKRALHQHGIRFSKVDKKIWDKLKFVSKQSFWENSILIPVSVFWDEPVFVIDFDTKNKTFNASDPPNALHKTRLSGKHIRLDDGKGLKMLGTQEAENPEEGFTMLWRRGVRHMQSADVVLENVYLLVSLDFVRLSIKYETRQHYS